MVRKLANNLCDKFFARFTPITDSKELATLHESQQKIRELFRWFCIAEVVWVILFIVALNLGQRFHISWLMVSPAITFFVMDVIFSWWIRETSKRNLRS
jgi:hypothetical protein